MVIEDATELLARFEALPAARPLLERLQANETEVHLVGGAVRDLMLGLAPVDLDLVVDGDLDALARRLGARIQLHDRFGTASARIGEFRYDLARPRRETYAHPGALPLVEPGELGEDLARRDFTVNAIALAIHGPSRGALRAFGAALEDLRVGRLAVLHDGSFQDDPTRLLRLARYQSRLGFAVARETRVLADAALDDRALQTISGSRLGAELRLLAAEPDPVAALGALTALGVAEGLTPNFGLRHPGLAERALALLPDDGDRAILTLAAASLEVDQLSFFLDRLAFTAEERARIVRACQAPMLADRLEQTGLRPSLIAEAVGTYEPEAVALAGALGPADAARLWLQRLRGVELAISGHDLLEAGVRRGPAIGRALRAALAAKLDGEAEGRDAELAVALTTARRAGGVPATPPPGAA